MMNAIEKIHALMVSEAVNIWHFPCAKDSPKFVYWLTSEPENRDGYRFDTLEAMVDAAYSHIDPLAKPSPKSCPIPPNQGSD